MMKEILDGCWSACYLPDTETKLPFVADAIIANPPSFGHIHCAEALSIPLHITFTMPWCTTQAFPHPLVNINSTNAEPGPTNAISCADLCSMPLETLSLSRSYMQLLLG